jgi:hypothetical protein
VRPASGIQAGRNGYRRGIAAGNWNFLPEHTVANGGKSDAALAWETEQERDLIGARQTP